MAAEMSFGHNLRVKKKEVITNAVSFLPWAQGCFSALPGCTSQRPGEMIGEMRSADTVDFRDAPARMLGVALHEYGSPHQFKVQLCALPREIKDHEVLIQVQAASLNPTDAKIRSGSLQQLCPLSLPIILGFDCSGVIVKAGRNSRFKVGDHVYGRQTLDRIRDTNGTYAEFCVLDSQDVCPKPSNITFEEAAAVPLAALTAMSALCVAGKLSYKNDTGGRRAVLILGGSGGVGTFAVQLAKHHLRCHTVATCSGRNMSLVEGLGADEVYDYNSGEGFLRDISKPSLGQGKEGFQVVIDCVGGDDYWEMCQDLLVDDGIYVTLVGSHRYGGEGSLSVGTALNAQIASGIRKGLGMIGASKQYTVLTPSMMRSQDLDTITELIESEKIAVVTDKLYSMYDVVDGHERLETHRTVGKCVLQVRKGVATPAAEGQEEDGEDDADEEQDLNEMVLDKVNMKLVPKHKMQQGAADGALGSDLKAKQLQVQQMMKAAMAGGGGGEERGGANGTLAEQQAKLEEMEALMAQQKLSSRQESGTKKSVKFGGEDSKVFEKDESAQEGVGDDGGYQEEEVGVGGKLSKKEQYRLMMMNMTEQQGADEDEEEEEEETEISQKKNAGVKKMQNSIVRTQGGVSHSGVLRRKKDDHGMFEDPYKTVCAANLDGGVLELRVTQNGEVVGLEERFDLAKGWSLALREDKKDRFTLVRGDEEDDWEETVTLKAENKKDASIWIDKLSQTAQWLSDGGASQPAAKPRAAAQQAGGGGDPVMCGVGMTLKQQEGTLVVKKLVDGAPAAMSGQIDLGDWVLKVNGKGVKTADEAAKLILGPEGTDIAFTVLREVGGKQKTFVVNLVRGKPRT